MFPPLDNAVAVMDMDGFTANKRFYCKELGILKMGDAAARSFFFYLGLRCCKMRGRCEVDAGSMWGGYGVMWAFLFCTANICGVWMYSVQPQYKVQVHFGAKCISGCDLCHEQFNTCSYSLTAPRDRQNYCFIFKVVSGAILRNE